MKEKKKEKILFFVDDENPFPNFWIFKRFNKKYRKYILQKIIPKIVKKYKNKNIKIISDCIIDFQINDEIKRRVECIQFGYLIKKYTSPKINVTKFVDKTFKSKEFKKYGTINNYDLAFAMAGQLKFQFLNDLDYIDIVSEIINKEKPTKILVLDKKSRIGKTALLFKNKIKIKEVVPKIILKKGYFINNIIKKYSLFARFHKIPFVKRREFLKTKSNIEIDKNKSSILVLGFDSTYYGRLENVVKELGKERDFQVISLTTDTKIQEKLEKDKVRYVSFGDFLNKKDINDIKKGKKVLLRRWKKIKSDRRIHDLFNYKGINLWNYVEKNVKYLLLNQFLWQLYYIKSIENLTRKINVKIIVSIDDWIPICRSVMFAGKKSKIPSLTVQPGILAATGGFCYTPIISDKFAVWGEITKKEMIKWGADPKKIVITGNPRFVKPEKRDVKNLKQKFGFEKNRPLVFLATECLEEYGKVFGEKEKITYLKTLIDVLKENSNYQLIIKLHPREEMSFYKIILPKLGLKNAVVVKDENLHDIINMCDVLITGFSTVVSDALIIGKPVIILNFLNRTEVVPFSKGGITLIKKKEDLIKIFKSSKIKPLSKKKVKKFIFDSYYKTDYKEPKRVVDLIKKIIKENI